MVSSKNKVLKDDAFHDPTKTGPRASYSIPSGGTFSIYASAKIAAPPQAVYDAILDCHAWKDWNSFIHTVRITKHPNAHSKGLKMTEGTCMAFTVKMTDEKETTSRETCTHIEKLKSRAHNSAPAITRIRWAYDNANTMMPRFLLEAERTNEIEEAADGTTLYRTWETFSGLLAGQIRKRYERALQERFQDWCKDLAKHVEKHELGMPSMPAELE